MNITEQQEIALEVLQKLNKYVDSGAIIAGGAPRNWDMGKLANDIDIYIRCYASNIKDTLKLLLGGDELEFYEVSCCNYDLGVKYTIKRISSFMYKNVSFQVIAVEPRTSKCDLPLFDLILGGFDTGINMIYAYNDRITGGLRLNKTKEYVKDISANTITVYSDNMSDSQLKHCIKTHIPKLQEYFPDYTLVFK